ncbi:MAG: hypothetical protein R3356_07175 [Eudoraea sp.]|nr:hypothetical protein [Eudoraea sp.]
MKTLGSKISVITLFAIAMALLEAAVVIYLREIMYPEGFKFPLEPIHPHIALTEILREAATLIMLVCIGLLSGRTFSQRFAWFIYSFAIWDIFYYIFLWILIGWPESLMTWDVLFLIPATWTGPVLSPLILTLLMISFAMIILYFAEKGAETRIRALEWGGLLLGVIVLVFAFIYDYMKHMLSEFSFTELLHMGDPRIREFAMTYIPDYFPWIIYSIGFMLLLAPISVYSYRLNKSLRKE